jgi:hypothetical protein
VLAAAPMPIAIRSSPALEHRWAQHPTDDRAALRRRHVTPRGAAADGEVRPGERMPTTAGGIVTAMSASGSG